ncbi:MAG: hypothetical protein HYT80_09925, partial [Euryarchaeota archaeon]|nr:hypothetical protein [Euryarchaeota archaeon]
MRRVLVLVLLLGLPLLVAVSASAVAQEAASPTYAAWRDLFMTVLWVAIVVSIIVYGALIYALIRFRARKGGPKEGPHIHGNTRLEIMWSIAPAVVMGWLLFISFDGLFMVDDHPDDDIDFWVDVTASQFRFDFSFPDGSESINGSFAVEDFSVNRFHAIGPAEVTARARAFLDLLGNQTTLSKGKTRALVQEEVRLRAQLAEARALAQEQEAGADAARLRAQVEATDREYRAFLERVRKENLEQASLMS